MNYINIFLGISWDIFFRIVDGVCTFGWLITGRWHDFTSKMYSVFEFVVHYLVHAVALIYFYGKVILTSRKALLNQADTTSSATQKVLHYTSNPKKRSRKVCDQVVTLPIWNSSVKEAHIFFCRPLVMVSDLRLYSILGLWQVIFMVSMALPILSMTCTLASKSLGIYIVVCQGSLVSSKLTPSDQTRQTNP